jgi:hypothetical protein
MIYDFATEVTCVAPVSTASITSSVTIDVTDGSDGVPALFGAGEQLYMQFEVTVAFDGHAAALAQFGVGVDNDTSTSGASLGVEAHILGMTGGTVATKIGFQKDELTVGRKFHLAIPPFDDVMEDDAGLWPHDKNAVDLATFRGMKYMGIVIVNPMDVTSSNRFTAGTVKARICTQASLGTAVLSNVYGSRMTVA